MRHKNVNWSLPAGVQSHTSGMEHQPLSIQISLLMDIRDELQQLNAVFACPNFIGMPATLRTISRKLTPRKRKAKP